MDEKNPVVLLSDGVWHIVDHSRRSRYGLCGRQIRQRQAHSRLRTIGKTAVCPDCLALHESAQGKAG